MRVTEGDWVAPDNVWGSAELALPSKKLSLAPFFRYSFPKGLHNAGGAPSPHAPPPQPPALPVLTGPPNLSSPLRVSCTAGGESWLEKKSTLQ